MTLLEMTLRLLRLGRANLVHDALARQQHPCSLLSTEHNCAHIDIEVLIGEVPRKRRSSCVSKLGRCKAAEGLPIVTLTMKPEGPGSTMKTSTYSRKLVPLNVFDS